MPIVPDQKDWTWVLARPCPECGFDATTCTPATTPGQLANMLPRWRAVLRRPDAAVRPDEDTWSPLEYACHVRAVFTLFDHRLALTAEGEQIAASFGRVPELDWDRKGTRSNGSEFTVLTFAQYFLHDVVHHLHDVDG